MPYFGTVYFIYEKHNANQEIQCTIGKSIFETDSRLCIYDWDIFWDIQKSGLKTGIESKLSEHKMLEFGSE